MVSLMKTHLLRITMIFSLAMLAVLVAGYFMRSGPRVIWGRAGASRGVEVAVDHGRVTVWYREVAQPGPAIDLGWTGDLFQFGMPDGRRSLWEFDAHWLYPKSGGSFFLLACPIWLAAIPFFIAPFAWWRKRRRKTLVGFPMERVTDAAISADFGGNVGGGMV